MSMKLQELRAQILIETLEEKLQDSDVQFPAETLNALLRISDYPLRSVLDFLPGNYPREVGERIVRLARDRLPYVASATGGGGAHTGSADADGELGMLVKAIEISMEYMEGLNKRVSSVSRLRRGALVVP